VTRPSNGGGVAPHRVLVTEVQERAGLAAIRALSASGHVVAGAASSRPAMGHWSRSCAERLLIPDPRADLAAHATRLGELADGRFDVVIPGTDASLIALSQYRRHLPKTRLGLPDHDAVERALDKVELLRLAADSGLPPPTSLVCRDAAEVRRAGTELGPGAVVKPRATCVRRGSGLRQQRGVVLTAATDVDRVLSALEPPVIVQRYVRGRIVSCAGVAAGGRMLAFAASTYLRTWPPDVGAASFARTVAMPADVVSRVEDVVRRMGWQGVFELELLDDGGTLRAIDFNPRIHGWLSLATAAGADLASTWCSWLLGDPPSAPRVARPGVSYRWEDGEALSALTSLRAGDVRRAAAIVRPRGGVVHATAALRDPLPLLARIGWVGLRLPRWLLKRRASARSSARDGVVG
jgi:predicted ATP-grasp superfamily ATP-dependent carboligase